MVLKISKSVVSVDWLFKNLDRQNLIIFDATIPKVTAKKEVSSDEKQQIKGAFFFDIQKTFSDESAPFPNTILSAKAYEEKAQQLGINKDSCIVVYDDLFFAKSLVDVSINGFYKYCCFRWRISCLEF
jgi:thiosulfate/3-mercaptopyruvate sulfurtransferase